MTLTEAQIEAIIKTGLCDASGLTDADDLHDLAYEALVNDAEVGQVGSGCAVG